MHPSHPPLPEVICMRCGHVNAGDVSRCGECAAPLDDFASTAPWEMGSAKGAAYPAPVAARTKPIVFWGAWLYFGPTALGAGVVACSSLSEIFSRSPGGQELTLAIAIILITGFYGVLSCWALWSVTAGYLKRR